MATRVPTSEIQERLKQLSRYVVRLVPIVVMVAAIGWFFLLRSPSEQTNTSGASDTKDTTAEPAADTALTSPSPEAKVADNSPSGESAKNDEGKLPETGPADTLAVFAITATAGTLFWEWHLRRAGRQT